MFLMWILPLLFVGLVAYAVSGSNLANVFRTGASGACPNCRRALQTDWKHCPHCGQIL